MNLKVLSVVLALGSLLSACAPAPSGDFPTLPPATVIPQPNDADPTDTAEVLAVQQIVQVFGSQLHMVTLTAPDAAQRIRQYYAEFISPALLEHWTSQPGAAPGRTASSPWPDRIEIENIKPLAGDKYGVTAFIIMLSSVEVVNGGETVRLPIHIAVELMDGRWIITEFTERITSDAG